MEEIPDIAAESMKCQRKGPWNGDEHRLFLQGLELYGRDWMALSQHIGSRDAEHVAAHAQCHFMKWTKDDQPPSRNVTGSGSSSGSGSDHTQRVFGSAEVAPSVGGVISGLSAVETRDDINTGDSMEDRDISDNADTENWKRWSVGDVLLWIRQQPTFGKYEGNITRLFVEDEVDGEAMGMMEMKDLKELYGINSFKDRKRILKEIQKLR